MHSSPPTSSMFILLVWWECETLGPSASWYAAVEELYVELQQLSALSLLLWSLLCSSHLINDCTSHRNFPFSIFCHPMEPIPSPNPIKQQPPDQWQDKYPSKLAAGDSNTHTSHWHNSTPGISIQLPWLCCCLSLMKEKQLKDTVKGTMFRHLL